LTRFRSQVLIFGQVLYSMSTLCKNVFLLTSRKKSGTVCNTNTKYSLISQSWGKTSSKLLLYLLPHGTNNYKLMIKEFFIIFTYTKIAIIIPRDNVNQLNRLEILVVSLQPIFRGNPKSRVPREFYPWQNKVT